MKTQTHLSDDWKTIKGSGLLSPERVAQIEAELAARTKPLITSGGTQVANAHTLTYPDDKTYLVTVTDYADIAWHQKRLIAALLTEDEIKLVNDAAFSRYQEHAERARFEKAAKVSDREYEGFVFWGDDYFSNVEEVLDRIVSDIDDPEDIPEYVWATEPQIVIPSLDVAEVVEHHIIDRGYEDMDTGDLNGVETLQAALNYFVEENRKVVCYLPDYKVAVVISPETRAELVAQIAEMAKGGS